MKYKLFATRTLPDNALAQLKKNKKIDLDVYEQDKKIPRGTLLRRVKGVDILLSLLTEKIDAEVMDKAGPQLKLIANYAVGFNNIDLKAAAERGIVVTNAPHPNISESVAEHTIALIFALSRRIVESDKFTRAGKYKNWDPNLLLGTDLYGKTIGIIGAGAIGSAVVHRMHDGFKMKVLYHDIAKQPKLEKETGAKYASINQLLKQSDIVTLHVPLLPSTHHLISTKELALMKKTALLINTARGPVVDEKALLKALIKGKIAGAGLDVFECEPLIDCDPTDHLELRLMDSVVMTPHVGSATIETRHAMNAVVLKNISQFISGKTPQNKVN
jgi:glyoxylate reductase